MITRYCWNCAAPLAELPPTRCASCGQEHYANPKPCGEAVVLRDGHVLLVRRANEPWLDCWDIPGGFCEADEHPMHAAERELFEEAGVAARAIAYLGTWMDHYGPPSADGAQEYTSNSAYVMRPLSDDVAPTPQAGEVSEVSWFALSNPPQENLAFPVRARLVLAVAVRFAADPGSFPEPPDRTWK
jgi:ADP-ribose pyrophosphatase YjhB (NUDIX family)